MVVIELKVKQVLSKASEIDCLKSTIYHKIACSSHVFSTKRVKGL